MAGTEKGTKEVFLPEKGKARSKRKVRARVIEDAVQMQERYQKEGYFNVAEIAFLMANDSFDLLESIGDDYGYVSEEYNKAFANTNAAVKTALPYFAVQMKAPNTESDNELDNEAVEDALAALLSKRK